MDFNYLYHRHGVASLMADNAACDRSRAMHRIFAAAYAGLIADELRRPDLLAA